MRTPLEQVIIPALKATLKKAGPAHKNRRYLMNSKETCPWCKKSMESGTLCSRGGTFFLPDGESLPNLYTKSSMDKKRAIILGQHSPVLGQIAPVQALICRNCKKIILSFNVIE